MILVGKFCASAEGSGDGTIFDFDGFGDFEVTEAVEEGGEFVFAEVIAVVLEGLVGFEEGVFGIDDVFSGAREGVSVAAEVGPVVGFSLRKVAESAEGAVPDEIELFFPRKCDKNGGGACVGEEGADDSRPFGVFEEVFLGVVFLGFESLGDF